MPEPLHPFLTTVTLTLADTDYLYQVPTCVNKISFQCRSHDECRFAFDAGHAGGKTEPYATLKAGQAHNVDLISTENVNIYFASSVAGTVIELVLWS